MFTAKYSTITSLGNPCARQFSDPLTGRIPLMRNQQPQSPRLPIRRMAHTRWTRRVVGEQMKVDGHTARDIARYLGVSRGTLYRYLAKDSA